VTKSAPLFGRLAFVGVGLIGSSIARAARAQGVVGEIVATARSAATRRRVVELGLADRVVETNAAAAAGAVVRRETHQGKGYVVRRMLNDVEADVYVLVDGDATYDAQSAPKLIDKLLAERLDMVVATRVDRGGDHGVAIGDVQHRLVRANCRVIVRRRTVVRGHGPRSFPPIIIKDPSSVALSELGSLEREGEVSIVNHLAQKRVRDRGPAQAGTLVIWLVWRQPEE